MKYRMIGKDGLKVSSIGVGCMGVSPFYGVPDDNESINTLRYSFESGVNFFDTSDLYGFGHSEKIVGQAISPFRQKIVLATKGGLVVDRHNDKPVPRGVNTTPKYIRKALEESLKRLKTDYVDLYYLHRIDPITPLEDTMNELKKLVDAGKILHIGLSEATAEQIAQAHAIHPISAVQSEYSLWYRSVEHKVLPLCNSLNIGFVPFSPLGRGFLTGAIKNYDFLKEYDFRKELPRFTKENFSKNYHIITSLERFSKEKKVTVPQIALSWLLTKSANIVPIPGISTIAHLMDNIKAIDVDLNDSDMMMLDSLCPEGTVAGERFAETTLKTFQTFASDESF